METAAVVTNSQPYAVARLPEMKTNEIRITVFRHIVQGFLQDSEDDYF